MNFLQFYTNIIFKYDLINKFNYTKNVNIPKLKKIILNINTTPTNITHCLIPTMLSLELILLKKSKLTNSKFSNLNLKIKKGNVNGCKIILKKKKMYFFFFKLIQGFENRMNN